MEFLRTTERVCRRRHKRPCFTCGLPVIPGDAYVETASVDMGAVQSVIEHAVCRDAVLETLDVYETGEDYGERVLQEYEDAWLPAPWVAWRNERRALAVAK